MSILNKNVKSTDKKVRLVNAITKLCLVLALVFFSIKTATANDTKKFSFPENLTEADKIAIQSSNGRYQMVLTSQLEGKMNYWYVLVWDTQTGRSKFYYGNATNGVGVAGPKFQLPAKPL